MTNFAMVIFLASAIFFSSVRKASSSEMLVLCDQLMGECFDTDRALFLLLRSEADTLTIAIEEAEKRKADHDARLVSDDRRRRELETSEICKIILAMDGEFDRTAALLHQMLTEREQLIGKLSGLNIIYRGVINAMRRKRNVNGAMAHAGLDQFLELERPGPDAKKSLTESDKVLGNAVMTGKDTSSVDDARQEVPA